MPYTEIEIRRLIAARSLEGLLVVDADGYMALSWLLHQTENDELIYQLLEFLETRFEGRSMCLDAPQQEKLLSAALYEITWVLDRRELDEVAPKLLAGYQATWDEQRRQIAESLAQPAAAAAVAEGTDSYQEMLLAVLTDMPFALEVFCSEAHIDDLFDLIATDEAISTAVLSMMERLVRECWIQLFQVTSSRTDTLLAYLLNHGVRESSLNACINLLVRLLADFHADEGEDSIEPIVDILDARGGITSVPFLVRLFSAKIVNGAKKQELADALIQSPQDLRILVLRRILIPHFIPLVKAIGESSSKGREFFYRFMLRLFSGLGSEIVGDLLTSLVREKILLIRLFELNRGLEDVAKLFASLRDYEQIFLLRKLESLEQRRWGRVISYLFPTMKQSARAFLIGSVLGGTSAVAWERSDFLRPLVLEQDTWQVMGPLLDAYDVLTRPERKGLTPSPAKRGEATAAHARKNEFRASLIQQIKEALLSESDCQFVLRIADLMADIYRHSQQPEWRALTKGSTSRIKGGVKKLESLSHPWRIRRKFVEKIQNIITFIVFAKSDRDAFLAYVQNGGAAIWHKTLSDAGQLEVTLLVHCSLQHPDLFEQVKEAEHPEVLVPLLAVAECYVQLLRRENLDAESESLKTLLQQVLMSSQLTSFGSDPVLQLTYYLYKLTNNPAMADKRERYEEIIPSCIDALVEAFPANLLQLVAMMQPGEFLRDGLISSEPAAASAATSPDLPMTPRRPRSRCVSMRSTAASPAASPRTPRVHQLSAQVGMSLEQRKKVNARRLMVHLNQQPHFLTNVLANPVARVAIFDAVRIEPHAFCDLLNLVSPEQCSAFFTLTHPETDQDMLSFIAKAEQAMNLLPVAWSVLQKLEEETTLVQILSAQYGTADGHEYNPVERVIAARGEGTEGENPAYLFIGQLIHWFKAGDLSATNMMTILSGVIDNTVVYAAPTLTDDLFFALLTASIERSDLAWLDRLATAVQEKFTYYQAHYAAAKAKAFLAAVTEEIEGTLGVEVAALITPFVNAILDKKYGELFICEPAYIALTEHLININAGQMTVSFQTVITELRQHFNVTIIGQSMAEFTNASGPEKINLAVLSMVERHKSLLADTFLAEGAFEYLFYLAAAKNLPVELSLERALMGMGGRVLEVLGLEQTGKTVLGELLAQDPNNAAIIKGVFASLKDQQSCAGLYYRSFLDGRRGVSAMPSIIEGASELATAFEPDIIYGLLYSMVIDESVFSFFDLGCLDCLRSAVSLHKKSNPEMELAFNLTQIYLYLVKMFKRIPADELVDDQLGFTDEQRVLQVNKELIRLLTDGLFAYLPQLLQQPVVADGDRSDNRLLAVLSIVDFNDAIWAAKEMDSDLRERIQFLQQHLVTENPLKGLLLDQIEHATALCPIYNEQLLLFVAHKHPGLMDQVLANPTLRDRIEFFMRRNVELFKIIFPALKGHESFFQKSEGNCGTALHRAFSSVDSIAFMLENLELSVVRAMLLQAGSETDHGEDISSLLLSYMLRRGNLVAARLLFPFVFDLSVKDREAAFREPVSVEPTVLVIQHEETIAYFTANPDQAMQLIASAWEQGRRENPFVNHLKKMAESLGGDVLHFYKVVSLGADMYRFYDVDQDIGGGGAAANREAGEEVAGEVHDAEVAEEGGEVVAGEVHDAEVAEEGDEVVAAANREAGEEEFITTVKKINVILMSLHSDYSGRELQPALVGYLTAMQTSGYLPVSHPKLAQIEIARFGYYFAKTEGWVENSRLVLMAIQEKLDDENRLKQSIDSCVQCLTIMNEEAFDTENYNVNQYRLTFWLRKLADEVVVREVHDTDVVEEGDEVVAAEKSQLSENDLSIIRGITNSFPAPTMASVVHCVESLDLRDRCFNFYVIRLTVLEFSEIVFHLFDKISVKARDEDLLKKKRALKDIPLAVLFRMISRDQDLFCELFLILVREYNGILTRSVGEDRWTLLHEASARRDKKQAMAVILSGFARQRAALLSVLKEQGGRYNLSPLCAAIASGLKKAVDIIVKEALVKFSINERMNVLCQSYGGDSVAFYHPWVVAAWGEIEVARFLKFGVDFRDAGFMPMVNNAFAQRIKDSLFLKQMKVVCDLLLAIKIVQAFVDDLDGKRTEVVRALRDSVEELMNSQKIGEKTTQAVGLIRSLSAREGDIGRAIKVFKSAFSDVSPVVSHPATSTLAAAAASGGGGVGIDVETTVTEDDMALL